MTTTHSPLVLDDNDDGMTLKSCATEFFCWVRAGIELIEESPAFIQRIGNDLQEAWHDSGKR